MTTPIEHPYLNSYHGQLKSVVVSSKKTESTTYQSNKDQIIVQKQSTSSDPSGQKTQTDSDRRQSKRKNKSHNQRVAYFLIRVFKITLSPRVAGRLLRRRHDGQPVRRARENTAEMIWNNQPRYLESLKLSINKVALD
jgi:uncharacterized membrane protein YcgQ (UPF0703/DUF1980 family)